MAVFVPPKSSAPRPVLTKPVVAPPRAAAPPAQARKAFDDFSNGRGSALKARSLAVTGAVPRSPSPSQPTPTPVAQAPAPSVKLPGGVTVATDGHVTFTQKVSLDVKAEASFEAGEFSTKVSAGPLAGTEVTVGWNPLAPPRPDGTYEVTVSVKSQAGAQASGSLKYGPFGLSGGGKAGVSQSQQVTLFLTPAQLGELSAGALPLPNLADPLAMPIGGTAAMSTGSFQSSQGSISYGGLSLSSSSAQTNDQTLAWERTGETTVRVTVGPTQTLKQQFGMGVSVGALKLSLTRDSSTKGSTLTSVEFDLATPGGQAAYEAFLRTGQLPDREGPGITDAYQEQTYSYEGSLKAGITLGPLSQGGTFWDENATITRRTENGQVLITAHQELATEGVSIDATFTSGEATLSSLTFTVPDPTTGGRVTVTVDGAEGFQSLRRAAVAQMQYAMSMTVAGELGISQAEALEWMKAQGGAYATIAQSPTDPGFSYEAFSEAFRTCENSGWSTPTQPMLTALLLNWKEGDPYLPVFSNGLAGSNTPQLAFGEPGFLGQPPQPGVTPAPSMLEMGLGDLPGVSVGG